MSQAQRMPPGENPADTYEQYFVPAMFGPWAQVLLERAAPQPGDHVLDVACGTGVVARHVAPQVGPTGTVVALDINPAMLAVARSVPPAAGAAIAWKEGSALGLPFPEATFDLMLCQQGLQFFPDRVTALREMRRVLRPHGRVALSVNQALQHNPVYAALFDAIARHLGTTAPAIATPFALGDADELRAVHSGWLSAGGGCTGHAHRPLPRTCTLVQCTVLSSAAVLPVFAQMDGSTHSAGRGRCARAGAHVTVVYRRRHRRLSHGRAHWAGPGRAVGATRAAPDVSKVVPVVVRETDVLWLPISWRYPDEERRMFFLV